MIKRIVIDIFLILLAFILPWWLTLLLVVAALFYFSEPPFWEGLMVGSILDIIYSGASTSLPFSIIFTTLIFLFLIITSILKKRLKFY